MALHGRGLFRTRIENLLTSEHVKEVLRIDKGEDCVYVSHEVVSKIITEGYYYGSRIIRSVVVYQRDGLNHEITYAINYYSSPLCILGHLFKTLFTIENHFFQKILPKLNEILQGMNERPLRTSVFVHSIEEEDFCMIFYRDFFAGYKFMEAPFNDSHVRIVIKELSKFHAASMVLFEIEDVTVNNLEEKYPILKNSVSGMKAKLLENGMDMLKSSITTGSGLCDALSTYGDVAAYLRGIKNINDKWDAMTAPTSTFLALRHGNLKSNSMLFRYSNQNNTDPIDVIFFDFQMLCVGPQSLDLNGFLYPWLTTNLRATEADNYIRIYYERCRSICRHYLIIFPLDTLYNDYKAKELFGFIMSLCLVPLSMMGGHHDLCLERLFSPSERENELKLYRDKLYTVIKKNKVMRNRVTTMLNHLQRVGFFVRNSQFN